MIEMPLWKFLVSVIFINLLLGSVMGKKYDIDKLFVAPFTQGYEMYEKQLAVFYSLSPVLVSFLIVGFISGDYIWQFYAFFGVPIGIAFILAKWNGLDFDKFLQFQETFRIGDDKIQIFPIREIYSLDNDGQLTNQGVDIDSTTVHYEDLGEEDE